MTVKEHYDKHLGFFYSWMTGDFRARADEFKQFLTDNAITPESNKTAIDLGAGHGIQSIPLAELGFNVTAVDFNRHLLDELISNAKDLNITVIHNDIKNFRNFAHQAELIVCCGDTLSHLDSKQALETLIKDISDSLSENGKLILSFRDYATALTGNARFIPVKSDDHKILTCILEYEDDFVNVSDLLYEKTEGKWLQKVSAYKKLRLTTDDVISYLNSNELNITCKQTIKGMLTIIAGKA